MASEPKKIKMQPGYTDEGYPELFDIRAMPLQPKDKKPGQLPIQKVKKFFEDGFVIVEDFFKKEELERCRDAVEDLVDHLAQTLHKAGKIKNLYSEHGLFERLTHIEAEFPGANIVLHKFGTLPQAFKDLWSNERLLNVIEQLIGPDIAGHPVWNLRTKTPQNEATTVPWHQDVGYLDNDSYKVLQPTAWIPLLDANEKNGCMELTRRGHKTGKVATHQCCYGGTWYVMLEEDEMEKKLEIDMKKDKVLCPVPYGGMLLLNNLVPHRSLPNLSNEIRWSLDLRWQNPKLPNGFYGMKECVLMRSSKDPVAKIDWEKFERVNRHKEQRESVKDIIPQAEESEFDTTIQGPWMKKWEIVHVNRHVEKMDPSKDYATWHGHKA
ncbi:hypothetical protein CHS0354_032478 [Potamilus streckersoni]|uniref:Uncharacterized protein n=1 Tax=Potamilus streckersoni TaxID=2493646 RepID=A0AAE0VZV8_9BIVA|nr:hypothetical protein CHS0354_032478 [Potamilus streckersoni]